MQIVRRALACVVAVGLLAAAGCGAANESGTGGTKDGKKLRYIMVSGSTKNDPYWSVVAKGLEDAGSQLGVQTEYRGPKQNIQSANDQRLLLKAAIATKPDGLMVQDAYPKSLNPVIREATDAGIPVVIVNSGIGETEATDALTVIASDDFKSGVVAGRKMKALGATRPLLVTAPPGAVPLLDLRRKGFEKGFGGSVKQANIPIDSFDDAGFIKNATEAALTKDSSIDGVMSAGEIFSPGAMEAKNALGDRGRKMNWGANDVTPPIVQAIKAKAWDFVIDQQQYSQPYFALVNLMLYSRYRIVPATKLTPTGPALVTAKNAEAVEDSERSGVR